MKSFLLILFFATSSWAHSFLDVYANRFGIPAADLLQFHQSLLSSVNSLSSLSSCEKLVADPKYLKCLSTVNIYEQKNEFFKSTLARIVFLYQQPQTVKVKKNLELMNYLLDVSRTLLAQGNNETYHWYDLQTEQFLKISNQQKEDFPFQNSDLLIAFGDKATSGMVSHATGASYRYSHGSMVHRTDRATTILESFPHLGAVELTKASLQQESYSRMLVLRLKKQFAAAGTKATQVLKNWADVKLPFDMNATGDDETKNYCTRMVAMGYSKALGQSLTKVFPDQGREPRLELNQLLNQVGIEQPSPSISPRSLIRSSYFEVVGEYSNTDTLLKFWQVDYITGYMENKVREGQAIKANELFSILAKILTLPINVSFSPLLFKSQQIIKITGPEKFATLATVEKKIYESSILAFEKQNPQANILQVPPWKIAEALETILNQRRSQFLDSMQEVLP